MEECDSNKKPASLAASGFKVLFEQTSYHIWWSWRDLNPRPKNLRLQYYMLSQVFTFATQLRTDTPLNN